MTDRPAASAPPSPDPFALKDCALAAIATGRRAQNLRELRDHLAQVDADSIYYHFWGGLLRPRFDDPEYNNGFAAWARHALHHGTLAERLGIIDPTDFPDLESLRADLLNVIESTLDETDWVPWARTDQQFHFIRSQIVVFDTARRLQRPRELVDALPRLSLGSVFYHLIDARRRTPDGIDDFRAWLAGFGNEYGPLCETLADIDPYFISLAQLRHKFAAVFTAYFEGTG